MKGVEGRGPRLPGSRRAARARGTIVKQFHTVNHKSLVSGVSGFATSSAIRAESAGELSSPGAKAKAKTISATQRPAYGRDIDGFGGSESEEATFSDIEAKGV